MPVVVAAVAGTLAWFSASILTGAALISRDPIMDDGNRRSLSLER
jgi:hypothetical protein